MKNNLPVRLRQVLASARGLGEPRFEVEMRITNWPENLANEVKELIRAIQTSGNEVELRACADILDAIQLPDVPNGLLRMLSRAIFDNPNTPLRGT